MQWCKASSREQGKTPCVSITFDFTASHKTREKLPNKRKLQMCEFLCSLLKLITQMVTRFDWTQWTHSRNVLAPTFTWHAIYYAIAWLPPRFILHCFTCLLLINQMFTIARRPTGKVQICKLAVPGVRLQILISNSNAQSSTPLIYTHNSKNILQKCWYQSTLWLLHWCMLWNKTLLSRLFLPK